MQNKSTELNVTVEFFFFAIWEMQLSIIQAIKRGKGLTSPWCASS